MLIERRGKDFIITNGAKDVASFDNFEGARQFLADAGNKDAQGKMIKFAKHIDKEYVQEYTVDLPYSRRR